MSTQTEEQRTLNGLYLFKELIKSGCEWQGDIINRKWSEALYIPEGTMGQVMEMVGPYKHTEDYVIIDNFIYLA